MASNGNRFVKYLLFSAGTGVSVFAVYKLIEQNKQVHFNKKQLKLKLIKEVRSM